MAEDRYKVPKVIGDVDAVPPPKRTRAESIYDPVILAATKVEGRWIKVDPKGRDLQTFRNGLKARLKQLDTDMEIRRRGKFIYMRYVGEGEAVQDMIKRLRDESRADYGD